MTRSDLFFLAAVAYLSPRMSDPFAIGAGVMSIVFAIYYAWMGK